MSNQKSTILCPGQGAQAVGMGKAWQTSNAAAADILSEADRILSDTLTKPLTESCFDGPVDWINRTDISQPAILACSVACWHGLRESNGDLQAGVTAGLSLGEYTALHIAGVMSFEDALRTVAARGRLMQEAAEASRGGMVALMGADDEAQASHFCETVLEGLPSEEILVPANFNAPGQIVLSGSLGACEAAVEAAAESGYRAKALPVAGAFHSPLMQPAADRMAEVLDRINLNAPQVPVWSNVTAQPHENDVETIKQRLVEQITSPVRWSQSLVDMIEQGCGDFHELAPGKVLKGLMKRVDRKLEVQNHDSPDATAVQS
ncbi:MAG: [acyl-carrier-protein] S-malonyltransferase [Phycisphaerae bacterium]|nr:[acyl-carrier-protein] S-malonyltransferase [Phycisphaerae bacterium]